MTISNRSWRRWPINSPDANLGLASVYVTEVGGQILPSLRLPSYRVTTVGIAGQFLVLNADSKDGDRQ